MKLGAKLLAAGAALFMSTQANAATQVSGQISIGGYAAPANGGSWDLATGIDAIADGNPGTPLSPGVAGGLTSFGAATGSFFGMACSNLSGSCGTIKDIPDFSAFAAILNYITLNQNNFEFDLNSITNISTSTFGGGSLSLTGNGIIRMTGYDPTAAVFTLTAQGNQITSFSASTTAVPEPGTWAMMILGFGALGYSLRRRRRSTGMLAQLA